jgi:hypothetical protein
MDSHVRKIIIAGNTKGGSIAVQFASYLTGLDLSVLEIKTKIVSCHTVRVKQEVNSKVILPLLAFPDYRIGQSSVGQLSMRRCDDYQLIITLSAIKVSKKFQKKICPAGDRTRDLLIDFPLYQ